MLWKVFEETGKYCVYKLDADGNRTGDALGRHETKAAAEAQIAALEAEDKATDLNKAANLGDYVESRIHHDFTVMADNLFGDGYLTREERIALSNGIGDALDAFHDRVQQDDLAGLYERRPWEEAPENGMAKTHTIPVKALGGNRIGHYAVIWGTAEAKDLTEEYFSDKTEELTGIFAEMKALPLLYHHAQDGVLKTSVVGRVDLMQPDEVGLWYEAQMTMAGKYKDAIRDLIGKQFLGTSTGTLPGARKVAADGHIERWPIVEVSLTPTPAEPRMMERPVAEVKASYKAIGLEFPEPKPDDAKGAVEAQERKAKALELERLALLELELTGV